MKRLVLPLLLWLAAALPARASDMTYEGCLSQVETAPATALTSAQAWNAAGGGAPAAHCVALALVALNRYGEAAQVLERIANDPGSGTSEARAELLAQAGNAWLLANEPGHGNDDLTRALVFAPGDIGLLYDRARARLMSKSYGGAMEDINAVLAQMPSDGSALLLRAKLRSLTGDPAGARADALAVLEDERNDSETKAAAQAILDAS